MNFDLEQFRGLTRSMQDVAMDQDDPDLAATCTLAVDWMDGAATEIERLRKTVQGLRSQTTRFMVDDDKEDS